MRHFFQAKLKPAKPFRMVHGSLIIQSRKKGISDIALVKENTKNHYLAHFVDMRTITLEDYNGKLKPSLRHGWWNLGNVNFLLRKVVLGLEKIKTKREDTSKTVIALASLVANVC